MRKIIFSRILYFSLAVIALEPHVPTSHGFELTWANLKNIFLKSRDNVDPTTTIRYTTHILPTPTPSIYRTVPTLVTTPSPAKSSKSRTCACGDETASVCASNGITYQNRCKFDCAKTRVSRVRIVGDGPCGSSMNRNDYWGSGKSRGY
ncbi:uncharacterized protein LOC110857730 [Folsomia candida]|uniref:Agrin n=1 Tax=Folsomia candida TaxID=158441 RepID=A0A226DGQ3_FOLCA|nr:uncharacterized protein LOC110857730 [Folsomia candida]OXA44359.1 Agrin [Folsomia candida]